MMHKRLTMLRRWIAPLAVILVALMAVQNLQAISDYVRLRSYTAPPEVSALADQTTMTDKARKLFYVNHPKLADRDSFNGACNSRGEQTIVLGCYHSPDNGIFLFEVSDQRLNGVEQVTAAHEMLHVAYDRLSKKERESIDAQLQDFYDHQVTDKRIRDTVAAYVISEPNDVVNEMHSIFATEIVALPPGLDTYYKQYFTDRTKVTQLASNYQGVFTGRQDQIKTYDAQLLELKDSIGKNTAELKRREAEISTMQRQMEGLKASNNIEAYNAMVPAYNSRIDQYNALIRSTQASISRYNQLVADRNAVAVEIRGLTQSISSQLSPIEQ